MTISFPSNTTDIIDQIRGAIGRNVNFIVLDGETPCPTCSLDPVTNTSTDSFCVTCSGAYWIEETSTVVVSGHVTWKPSDMLNWYTGGQLLEGDCRVQIKRSVTNLDVVDRTKYVVLDDKKLYIQSVMHRGVPQLNRILIDLKEEGEDDE